MDQFILSQNERHKRLDFRSPIPEYISQAAA
jgi:hypothetical protein